MTRSYGTEYNGGAGSSAAVTVIMPSASATGALTGCGFLVPTSAFVSKISGASTGADARSSVRRREVVRRVGDWDAGGAVEGNGATRGAGASSSGATGTSGAATRDAAGNAVSRAVTGAGAGPDSSTGRGGSIASTALTVGARVADAYPNAAAPLAMIAAIAAHAERACVRVARR